MKKIILVTGYLCPFKRKKVEIIYRTLDFFEPQLIVPDCPTDKTITFYFLVVVIEKNKPYLFSAKIREKMKNIKSYAEKYLK